jgi:glutathione S-transferase
MAVSFITLDEAAAMTEGVRITFIPGIQALYAEALKNICFVKDIPVIRALHPLMGVDKKTGEDRQKRLYELTSQTSLPTMFFNDERPRNVWIEQLALAEKIGSANSPALIPLGQKYGYTDAASSTAPAKIAEVIGIIDRRLQKQAEQGSRYLVGETLTAADIYWATMSMCITAVPPEIMPVTEQNQGMLKFFAANSNIPIIAEVLSPRIEEHQRHILQTHCETPAVLGGDPI